MFEKNSISLIECKAAISCGNKWQKEWQKALVISDHHWLSDGRQGAPLYLLYPSKSIQALCNSMMVYFLIRLLCFKHYYNKLKIYKR